MSKKKYAICSICKKELPLNRENFKRIKNKITGKEQYYEICRNCEQYLKNEEHSKEWESGKLLCHICGEYKDPIEFQHHTYYAYRNHKDKRCNKCKQIQNREARNKYSNEIKLYKVLQERWFAAKDRASNKGIPFTISKEDLLNLWNAQNGLCSISKIPMTYELDNGRVFTNVSVDQINPGQGYTKDNIQLICSAVNQLKSNWDMDTVLYVCKQITINYE